MNYKTPKKAIITDAGFASRYLPITKTIPKAMLPLGNRPIMQLVVEECVEAGIEEIIIVATPEGKEIYNNYFHDPCLKIENLLVAQGKAERYEPVKKVLDFPKITVIEQDQSLPYGNGSPVASAREFINEDEAFIVAYSDDVVFGASAVKDLIEAHQAHPDAKAIIAGQEMPHEEMNKYGAISLKDESKMTLKDIIEKSDDAPSNLASYGRYLLTPDVFTYLDPKNIGKDGELWTVDAITKMAEVGDVYVEKTKGHWMTTGDPKNYFLSHLQFVKDSEDYFSEIKQFVNQ